MDIQEFIEKRPYLYHLTSSVNAQRIIQQRIIYSANRLIDKTNDPDEQVVKRQKRVDHHELTIDGESYLLRDQRPISEVALSKCLIDNWQVADFLEHLNDRVFMWPTLERLWRHYNRYQREAPLIFRFDSSEVLELNSHVKFCRLNSGATRANSYLGGKAPERGPNTFLPADDYKLTVGSVAEVTFEGQCNVHCKIYASDSPDGIYEIKT